MIPKLALAHYVIGNFSTDKIIEQAHSWLIEGIYSDSLNYLVMESNPSMELIGPMFETALFELGYLMPTKVDAAWYVTADIIQKMANGSIDLLEGANFLYYEIHQNIKVDLPDGEYLGSNLGLEYIFCWLREVWDCRDGSMILYHTDLPRAKAEIKFLENIKEEAEKWLINKA